MLKAKFAIEVSPESWLADVSSSFPDAQLRLLTGIQVDDHAVELGEVIDDAAEAADEMIADHPDIRDHERLYVGDDRVMAQYWTTELSLYEFMRRSSVPPEFPVVVENGWSEFEITAPREQIQDINALLEHSDRSHEVLAVVNSADRESLLTDRQRDLLETAIQEGYYTVPRECTLSELAAETGIDKSTASGIVRRAESRLVTWFLTGSGGGVADI